MDRIRKAETYPESSPSPKRANSEEPTALSSTQHDPQPTTASSPLELSSMALEDTEMQAVEVTPPTPEVLTNTEKFQMISNFRKQPLTVGDIWYLVDRKWYRLFEESLSDDTPAEDLAPLPPIGNSKIATSDGELIGKVTLDVDVVMLPDAAWQALQSWYGPADIAVPRKVIPGAAKDDERVEFYLPTITAFLIWPEDDSLSLPDGSDTTAPFHQSLSAATKFTEMARLACNVRFALDPKKCRFWKLQVDGEAKEELLKVGTITPETLKQFSGTLLDLPADPTNETLESLGIMDGDLLAVDSANDGKWQSGEQVIEPSDTATSISLSSAAPVKTGLFSQPDYISNLETKNKLHKEKKEGGLFGSLTSMMTRSKKEKELGRVKTKGLMGLSNLGNTCFMNSSLQCMSNTAELNQYFLAGVHREELNKSNPLGMKGQVAEEFGRLIEKIWTGSGSSISPGDFKRTIGKFAPSFSGYQQHDAQEFITFLLDGLHEDLNRIKKKPYTESPDWMGGGDVELAKLAQTCWEQYKKRNDSVIVDLFQGQYKSTLVCPVCSKVSITFDPFMYLTLPLPVKKKYNKEIFFVPKDVTKPRLKIDLSVPKDSSFQYVKSLLGTWFNIDPTTIIAADVFSGSFYKFFSDYEPISECSLSDVIIFYEVGCPVTIKMERVTAASSDVAIVPVFSTNDTLAAGDHHRHSFRRNQLFGIPFFVSIPSSDASDPKAIAEAVAQRYRTVSVAPEGQDSLFWTPQNELQVPAEETNGSTTIKVDGGEEEPVTEIHIADGAGEDVNMVTDEIPVPSEAVFASAEERSSAKPLAVTQTFSCPIFTVCIASEPKAIIPNGKDIPESLTVLFDSKGRSVESMAPLVRTGAAIFCEWNDKAGLFTFGNTHKDSIWQTGLESFSDPTVEKDASGKKPKKVNLDIEDCLNEFSRAETLGENDLWYCSSCKEHRAASKKLELWKVPDILVVHLKRFGGGVRSMRDKIDNLIECPLNDFDLSSRVCERQVAINLSEQGVNIEELGLESIVDPLIYDLYAVSNHYGGLGGGHYTAAAKNDEDHKWHYFDDSRVSPLADEASVITPAAYVLFYRRKTTRPIGGLSRIKVAQSMSNSAAPSVAPTDSAPNSGRASPVSMSDAHETLHREFLARQDVSRDSPSSDMAADGDGEERERGVVEDALYDDDRYSSFNNSTASLQHPSGQHLPWGGPHHPSGLSHTFGLSDRSSATSSLNTGDEPPAYDDESSIASPAANLAVAGEENQEDMDISIL